MQIDKSSPLVSFICRDKKHNPTNMAVNDWPGRQAMMRPSSTRTMPVTWRGDILPMVLSSLGAQPETLGGQPKTSLNFLKAICDINKESTVQLYEITGDRYKRNLQVVFQSDLIINTCKSIHERPLGACINLHFAEDVKWAASVLKKISFVAPRVPRPKRMGTTTSRPLEYKLERLFESSQFDCEIDIPEATYQELVEATLELQKHAQDQMNVEPKHTYVKRMRDELTKDVSRLLNNSQTQMKMGVVNVHLNHMATNSASVDMLSTLDEVGTGGEECWLSTTLDIMVQKQLEQWLVPEEGHASAIKNIIKIFDEQTSTPTQNASLHVTVSKDGRDIPLGGVAMISGATSLNVPTLQMEATYKRNVREFQLKSQDYNTNRLMVEPNIAREAFPNYTMDDSIIVKEHQGEDVPAKEAEKKVVSTMTNKGNVTMLLTEIPDGVILLDNVSSVYIVDQDRDLDPLTSILTHTTTSMWNMHHGYSGTRDTSEEFQKSDQMSHVYADTSTPDLYLNPTGKARQKIRSCIIKDAVFNDPYIYSPYFAECFNTMYRAAMKLTPTSPTRILFTKCNSTAVEVYKDAHMWHARYRSKGCFTSAGNGDMIMNELHPYFDALSDGGGLKAYDRLVHGNIPLYIRPASTMLVSGQTLARKIWGTTYREFTATTNTAKKLAKEIDAFFAESVSTDDRAATHMLYSFQTCKLKSVGTEDLKPPKADLVKPITLIEGLCAMPFLVTGSIPKADKYEWKDTDSKFTVYIDVPQLDENSYKEEQATTRFFYTLKDDERPGATTFSYMVRPAFHELMKEIRTSSDCLAVKMCAMFCAWIRLTPEGTEFAFNYTRWPLAANVLTFKQDSTKHILFSRPNSVISLADMPTTEIKRDGGYITIESTAHHRIACDGINPNSVIAPHILGSSRTQSYAMIVSTLPTQMKDNINAPNSAFREAFAGYRKLMTRTMDDANRNKTNLGKKIISLTGEQLAWVCPPVVPCSEFQRPTNPTGRSSLPRMSNTPLVDANVEMHDPTRYNGTRDTSTLNPYATLPGGYVFCLHADPNGKVGEVSNCTYRNSRGASRAAHFFSPPQLLVMDKTMGSSMALKIANLPCSRRVLGDQERFPTFIDGASCNSSMAAWSEITGLAQHEPHASNRFIYDNMISSRQSDSTYAVRDVVWYNHHYGVPGHTFYAKNKTYASKIVSPA